MTKLIVAMLLLIIGSIVVSHYRSNSQSKDHNLRTDWETLPEDQVGTGKFEISSVTNYELKGVTFLGMPMPPRPKSELLVERCFNERVLVLHWTSERARQWFLAEGLAFAEDPWMFTNHFGARQDALTVHACYDVNEVKRYLERPLWLFTEAEAIETKE